MSAPAEGSFTDDELRHIARYSLDYIERERAEDELEARMHARAMAEGLDAAPLTDHHQDAIDKARARAGEED